MKRIVATFDESEAESDARRALREAGFEPSDPDIENPFFDPVAELPERRGLLWGGLIGGLLGAALLFALDQHVFWVPRISPIMTAGQYELVFLGFGLGVAVGGFLGGALGTARQVPERDRPRVAVQVPDDRVGEAKELLRTHGATAIGDAVTYHDHPHRTETTESS